MSVPLEVGQPAPEFSLKGPGGAPVTLSEYHGRKHVVLVFFPLAFSPACSHQLPDIQRALPRFEAQGATVLGVSVDSHWANEAFAERLGVTFPLLSDFRRAASTAYGVLMQDHGFSGRAMFVVGRDGRIAWREVSANPGDLAQAPSVERALQALHTLNRPV